MVKSRLVSVYEVDYGDGDYVVNYACHIATRMRTELTEEPIWLVGGGDPPHVAKHTLVFAGDWVAFSWTDEDADTSYFGVDVVDARHRTEGTVDSYSLYLTDPGVHRINRIVLRKSGVLAWSTRHRILRCRDRCRDRALAGKSVVPKLLASGARVVGSTLRGKKHGITWLEGGRWRFAHL